MRILGRVVQINSTFDGDVFFVGVSRVDDVDSMVLVFVDSYPSRAVANELAIGDVVEADGEMFTTSKGREALRCASLRKTLAMEI